MRDYGKVHTKFWDSDTIREMSEDARMLALYLLTCKHNTITGVFRLPDGYVCEDIKWGSERVCKGFAELLEKGFANRCETTKWVWVCKHLEWNPPENPNQRKSARKIAQAIPTTASWHADFRRVCGEQLEIPTDPIANPSETVTQPFLNQKQEQKQEQEQELTDPDGSVVGSNAANSPRRPECPHQEIIALYHEILPMCPEVRDWTAARQTSLRTRWNEDPSRQNLDYWRRFFTYVSESDFLTGKAKAKPGTRPFLANLEWLITAGNFTKIRERNYEND